MIDKNKRITSQIIISPAWILSKQIRGVFYYPNNEIDLDLNVNLGFFSIENQLSYILDNEDYPENSDILFTLISKISYNPNILFFKMNFGLNLYSSISDYLYYELNSGVSLFGFNFQYFGKIKDEENKYFNNSKPYYNISYERFGLKVGRCIYRDKQYKSRYYGSYNLKLLILNITPTVSFYKLGKSFSNNATLSINISYKKLF